MFTLPVGLKLNQLNQSDLREFERLHAKYFEKSIESETNSINDLISHLWLANGSAATVCIGIFQSKGFADRFHFYGVCSFIVGLVVLLIFKFFSEWVSSRDRHRFQLIVNKIINLRVNVDEFLNIRDSTFHVIRKILIWLRLISASAFIVGLSLTLYSFRSFALV